MKTCKLVDRGNFKAKEVLKQVLNVMPQGGNVEQIRLRCGLLDEIDKAADTLTLEDAPYGTLVSTINNFPFQIANADLLAVLDGILKPQEP